MSWPVHRPSRDAIGGPRYKQRVDHSTALLLASTPGNTTLTAPYLLFWSAHTSPRVVGCRLPLRRVFAAA